MTALPRTATAGSMYGGEMRQSPGFPSAPLNQGPPLYGGMVERYTPIPQQSPTPVPTHIPQNPSHFPPPSQQQSPVGDDSFELIENSPSYPVTPSAPSKKKRRENLTLTVDKRLTPVPLSPTTNSGLVSSNVVLGDASSAWVEQCKLKVSTNPFLMLFLLLIAFILFDFWSNTIQRFIKQRFHEGKEISWKAMLLYAILFTVAFGLLVWALGVPFTQFESI